jgi:hypothetical protein
MIRAPSDIDTHETSTQAGSCPRTGNSCGCVCAQGIVEIEQEVVGVGRFHTDGFRRPRVGSHRGRR